MAKKEGGGGGGAATAGAEQEREPNSDIAPESGSDGLGVAGGAGAGASFKPYTSILKVFSESEDQDGPEPADESGDGSAPPWRRAVGMSYLMLPSDPSGNVQPVEGDHPHSNPAIGDGSGEEAEADELEEQRYIEILERTFRNCAFPPVGTTQPVIDLAAPSLEPAGTWSIDPDPRRGQVQGDSEIAYNATDTTARRTGGHTSTRTPQACWNCLQPGHTLADCPEPRNYVQIRLSREGFTSQKETMPDFAIPHLQGYTFTEDERSRRLDLLAAFRPGRVSPALQDALFWVDEDAEDEEIAQAANKKRRKDWPWLRWMMRWGYPSGWIAGRNPIEEVRRRLLSMPITVDEPDDTDSEDDLCIFGDLFDTPSRKRRRDSTPAVSVTGEMDRGLEQSPNGSGMSMDLDSENESTISTDRTPLSLAPPESRKGSISTSPPAQPSFNSPSPPRPPPDDTNAPPPPIDDAPPPPEEPPSPPAASPPPDRRPPTRPRADRQHPPRDPTLPAEMRRWANFNTDMFDSNRLQAYSSARPLPLGW